MSRKSDLFLLFLLVGHAHADFSSDLTQTALPDLLISASYPMRDGKALLIARRGGPLYTYQFDGDSRTASASDGFVPAAALRYPSIDEGHGSAPGVWHFYSNLTLIGGLIPVNTALALDASGKVRFWQNHSDSWIAELQSGLFRITAQSVGSATSNGIPLNFSICAGFGANCGISGYDPYYRDKFVTAQRGGFWMMRYRINPGGLDTLYELVRVNTLGQIVESKAVFQSNSFLSLRSLVRDRQKRLRLRLSSNSGSNPEVLLNLRDEADLQVESGMQALCANVPASCDYVPLGSGDWMRIRIGGFSQANSVITRLAPAPLVDQLTLGGGIERYQRSYAAQQVQVLSTSASGAVVLGITGSHDRIRPLPNYIWLDALGNIVRQSTSWRKADFNAEEDLLVIEPFETPGRVAALAGQWFNASGAEIGVREVLSETTLSPLIAAPLSDGSEQIYSFAEYPVARSVGVVGLPAEVRRYQADGRSELVGSFPAFPLVATSGSNPVRARNGYAYRIGNKPALPDSPGKLQLQIMNLANGQTQFVPLCFIEYSCTVLQMLALNNGVALRILEGSQKIVLIISQAGEVIARASLNADLALGGMFATPSLPQGDTLRFADWDFAAQELEIFGVDTQMQVQLRYRIPFSHENSVQINADGGATVSETGTALLRRYNPSGMDLGAFADCGQNPVDDGKGGRWAVVSGAEQAFLCYVDRLGNVSYSSGFQLQSQYAPFMLENGNVGMLDNSWLRHARANANGSITLGSGPAPGVSQNAYLSVASTSTALIWVNSEQELRDQVPRSRVRLRAVALPELLPMGDQLLQDGFEDSR